MRRHPVMAFVDTVMFFCFLAVSSPGSVTGFILHEWFGLAFLALLVLHLALSWGWVAPAFRRGFARREGRSRINVLLNTVLLAMMSVAIVSGVVISDYILASAGLPTSDAPRCRNLHNVTASLVLVTVGLHVALNWTWIRAVFPHVGRERPAIVEHGRRTSALRESVSPLAAERQSIKERRAARDLTAGDAIVGLSVPLVWIALFAVVGRRGFALRV